MQQRRTGLLALLAIATIAVAAWWLWNLDAGGTPRANVDAAADAVPGKAAPTDSAPVAPAANAPATATPEAQPGPESKPETQPEVAAHDEPAIAPVYGDLLKRGGAVVTFDLRDAQGQWLINEPVTTRLIRKLGRYSMEEDCFWSFDDGTVVCDGESSAGLEPGTYELEVVASYYGWLRHTFTVQRGEKSRFELRLPYWRRIVTCHLNDLSGNPLPFLPAPPRVETTKPAPPVPTELSAPGIILRAPPTPSGGGMGGGGGRGGRGGFVRRGSGNSVFVTDGGKWYLAVFAGASNKINAEGPGGPWPGDNLTIEGNFDSAAEAQVEFRLNAPADLDTRYADNPRVGADNPGQRSLLEWAARKGAHLPLTDPADVAPTSRRVVVNVTGAQGLQPWFASVIEGEEGQPRPAPAFDIGKYRPPRRRDGQWFFDIPMDIRAWLCLWDGAAFVTDPELIETTQMVTTIARAVIATEIDVLPWLLPQTVDGWAVHRELVIFHPANNRSPRGDAADLEDSRCYDLTRARLLLAPDTESYATDPQTRSCLLWRLGGSARQSLNGRSMAGPWVPHWETAHDGNSDAGGDVVLMALKSGAQGPALKSGLYFRAVDARGAGLPWVEATLHTLEDDARAQRLRELERRGHKDGWRPSLSTSFANARFEDPSGLSDDDLRRERVREFVGEDFERECKDDADLKFYLRTGAWYDSYTRLRGGEYGYHVDLERKLTPGKKYVLYLWSNSRDDLQPDARIVFQAAEVTDLGLITLPAYTE